MSGYIKLPAATAPAAAPAPAAGGAGSLTVNKNLLMVGGLVVVAVIALVNSRRGGTTGTAADYNIDTTSTDLYNDLQPELEQIGDRISRLENPAPAKPDVSIPKPPGTPKPAPKPGAPRDYLRYVVKQGDTIASVAKRYHVSAASLYEWNKGAIGEAAAAHGRKVYGVRTVIWPGTALTIKTGLPGQRGVKLG